MQNVEEMWASGEQKLFQYPKILLEVGMEYLNYVASVYGLCVQLALQWTEGVGPSDFQEVPSSVLSFGDSVDFNSTNRR